MPTEKEKHGGRKTEQEPAPNAHRVLTAAPG